MADPPKFTGLCDDAQQLFELCEGIMQQLQDKPTERMVENAKLEVLDCYVELYESVTKEHKQVGERKNSKHTCIFEIFMVYQRELRKLKRKVRPPLRPEPPPPLAPPAPAPQISIAGLPVGALQPDDES